MKEGERAVVVKSTISIGDQVLFKLNRDKYVAIENSERYI